jgi:hypothetical protein
MSFLTRKRPSAAMVVACVALSFALAGTAIAGTDAVTSTLDKQEKKQVKKIAKKQANKRLKANVDGSHVNLADQATNATTAANGAAGYANFRPNGALRGNGAFNMNDLTVSAASPAIYCEDQAFNSVNAAAGLGAPPIGGIHDVTVFSNEEIADFGLTPGGLGCPANSEWVYVTYMPDGPLEPASFSVIAF